MAEFTIYTFEAIIKTYYDVKETIELHSKESKTLQELNKEITTLIITIEKLRQIPPDVKIQTHCNDLQILIDEIHKWIIETIANKEKTNFINRFFTTRENCKKINEYIVKINNINKKIEKYLNIGNHLLSHELNKQMESLIEAVNSNPDYERIMDIIKIQKELFETKMKDYTDALLRSEQFYKSSIKDFDKQQILLQNEINKLKIDYLTLKNDNLEIKNRLLELEKLRDELISNTEKLKKHDMDIMNLQIEKEQCIKINVSKYEELVKEKLDIELNYKNLQTEQEILKLKYDNIQVQTTKLENEFKTIELLRNQDNKNWESKFNSLQTEKQSLESKFNSLYSSNNSLQSNYNSLQSNYYSLQSNYNSAQSNYNSEYNKVKKWESVYENLRQKYNRRQNAMRNMYHYCHSGETRHRQHFLRICDTHEEGDIYFWDERENLPQITDINKC